MVEEDFAFYVADEKYIVCGPQSSLKKVIERNKAASLSPVMAAGLKEAGFKSAANLVVDLRGAWSDRMEVRYFKSIKANFDKAQALAVKVDQPGKVRFSVTLISNDAADADVSKGIASRMLEKGNAALKIPEAELKNDSEFKKFVTDAGTTLKSIVLSTAGNNMTASIEAESAALVDGLFGSYVAARVLSQRKAGPETTPKK